MTARARGDGKGRARVKKRGHSEELGAGQKCPWAAHDPLGSSTAPNPDQQGRALRHRGDEP